MSFMVLGSMMEADKRLREHEILVRNQKKILRDAEVWRRYEEDYQAQASASSREGRGRGGGAEKGRIDQSIRREE
jgi:hypothetical protein